MIGMNPQRLQQLAEKLDLDNDDVQEALMRVTEEKARPKLNDVRERAAESESQEQVRERLSRLSEEDKNEVFHQTWAELITAAVQLRVEPMEGMKNLKTMIRDPFTIEVLLLMFEDDEIPSDITEANKDLVSDYISWIGRGVAPEMYEREEVEEMVEQFGADPELLDKWDEDNVPDDL